MRVEEGKKPLGIGEFLRRLGRGYDRVFSSACVCVWVGVESKDLDRRPGGLMGWKCFGRSCRLGSKAILSDRQCNALAGTDGHVEIIIPGDSASHIRADTLV